MSILFFLLMLGLALSTIVTGWTGVDMVVKAGRVLHMPKNVQRTYHADPECDRFWGWVLCIVSIIIGSMFVLIATWAYKNCPELINYYKSIGNYGTPKGMEGLGVMGVLTGYARKSIFDLVATVWCSARNRTYSRVLDRHIYLSEMLECIKDIYDVKVTWAYTTIDRKLEMVVHDQGGIVREFRDIVTG